MSIPSINSRIPLSLSRIRGFGLVALCAAPLAVLPASSAAATEPVKAATPATTVTLITGDKVTTTADGGVQVRDEAGRLTGFLSHRQDGDTFVYPHEVLPYLASGLLDDDLFNITELVADGYDD